MKFEDYANQYGKEAASQIKPYITVLVLDDKFIGSGTFVCCENIFGILTAHHVFHQAINRKSKLLRLTVTPNMEHDFQIPLKHIEVIDIGIPQTREYGPDISFIKISDIYRDRILVRKSFFNISNNKDDRLASSMENESSLWIIFCCPAEFSEFHQGEKFPCSWKLYLFPYICSGPSVRFEKNQFDYSEIKFTSSSIDTDLTTFQGTSGAGLWKVPLRQLIGESVKKVVVGNPVLSGVVFYETYAKNRDIYLRFHAGKTIYDHVYNKLRELPNNEG